MLLRLTIALALLASVAAAQTSQPAASPDDAKKAAAKEWREFKKSMDARKDECRRCGGRGTVFYRDEPVSPGRAKPPPPKTAKCPICEGTKKSTDWRLLIDEYDRMLHAEDLYAKLGKREREEFDKMLSAYFTRIRESVDLQVQAREIVTAKSNPVGRYITFRGEVSSVTDAKGEKIAAVKFVVADTISRVRVRVPAGQRWVEEAEVFVIGKVASADGESLLIEPMEGTE